MGARRENRERAGTPWYRSHPREAVLLATALFALVTLGRIFADQSGEAVDILYSLPVALLAVAFGLRGGLVGAIVGIVLFAVVEIMDGVGDIDATGWISRGAGLLLLGILLGRATDQIEEAQQRELDAQAQRQRLEETTCRQATALEVSDSILQHLTAAKWMIEQGRDEEAIALLTTTIAIGQDMVGNVLPMVPGAPTDPPTRVR